MSPLSQTLGCSVASSSLQCNLTVAGQQLPVEAEAPCNASVFDPAIPINLGLTQSKLGNSVGLEYSWR